MKFFIGLAGILSVMLCGCTGYKYQADNVGEEIVEEGIKLKTGVDVDLSPSTPESGFTPGSLKPFVKETASAEGK